MIKLVVFTGAGISVESGLKPFRGYNGLWEDHDIMKVATPEGWRENQALVLDFYNMRREKMMESQPNKAHKYLAVLENFFHVQIITQNIDDLHERAGCKHVLHLHGELMKARSTIDHKLTYRLTSNKLNVGDLCEKGSQLRPDVVWFGEEVSEMDKAYKMVRNADIFIIIGTSLNVFPAAGLVHEAKKDVPKFLIDPEEPVGVNISHLTHIKEKATSGIEKVTRFLLENYS